MTGSQMYWLLKLDDIRTVVYGIGTPFLVVGITAFVAIVICLIIRSIFDDGVGEHEGAVKAIKFLKPLTISFIIGGSVFTAGSYFLPTTKQMAAIYVVPAIANNKAVCEIPERMVNLANEWLEELRPGKALEGKAKPVEKK